MGNSICSAASLPAGVSALLYLPPKQEPASLHVCSFDVFLDVGEPERMEVSYLPPWKARCLVRISCRRGSVWGLHPLSLEVPMPGWKRLMLTEVSNDFDHINTSIHQMLFIFYSLHCLFYKFPQLSSFYRNVMVSMVQMPLVIFFFKLREPLHGISHQRCHVPVCADGFKCWKMLCYNSHTIWRGEQQTNCF